MQMLRWVFVAALAAGAYGAGLARADIINYGATGPDGSQTVSGSAVFTLSGNQLTIELTNNTTAANMNGTADLLTAVKFELSGGLSLSNGSATGKIVNVNSNLSLTAPSNSQNLDNGWGGGNIAGNPDEYGAAAGLNLGSGKSFDGTNLDGADYGLIPTVSAVSNKDGFPQSGPYTYGTATLTFDVSGSGTLANDLSNVTFLWGTTPDATTAAVFQSEQGVPEPGSIVLIPALLCVGVGARRLYRPNRSVHCG